MALDLIYTRSTNNMSSGMLLRQLSSNSNDLFRIQQQLATGRRILAPSMDALGATEFLGYQSRISRNTGYENTIEELKNKYNFIDGELGSSVDTLNSLKSIALRESDDGASDEDTRNLAATEVNQLRNAVMAAANARFQGQSVFGGRNTTEQAFSIFGDAVKFNGTHDVNSRKVEDYIDFESSLTAEEVFGDLHTVSASRVDLNSALALSIDSPPGNATASTPLSALNGGNGVDLGVLSVAVYPDGATNTGSAINYDVDLRGAKTIADVVEAFNNTRGRDGNPVFDATTYSGAGTTMPQDGSSRVSGLRITAVGEAAQAIVARPAEIRFIEKPGRSTARDLGLVTGEISFQTTSDTLGGTYTGTYDFDLNVNGQGMNISVTPGGGGTLADLASALQSEIDVALGTNNLFDFNVAIAAVDTDNDATDDALTFDITDQSGTGSFELVASNAAAIPLADAFANGQVTQQVQFNKAAGSFKGGIFGGRDLNPSLNVTTKLSDLFGGNGMNLESLADGTVIEPQGITITNGSLQEDIDLSDLLSDSNATVGDLMNRINGSGVQAVARISEDGDRIEIASNLIGVPVKVANLNGSLGTQLGIDSRFNEMRVVDLNDGRGLGLNDGADLRARTSTNIEVEFDFGDAKTVEDVVTAINNDTANRQPNGDLAFEASAVTERRFRSGIVTNQLANSPTFEVSLNGSETRTLSLTGPFATMDAMATAMEDGINAIATQLGLDDFNVNVIADNNTNALHFQVQDADGPAEIDFSGGFTALFDLDGAPDGTGRRELNDESVSQRFLLEDKTFDATSYQRGDSVPIVQNIGLASVLEDLGLAQSDATRRQHLGSDAYTSFDSSAAVALTMDFSRGPQLAINVAASVGRTQDELNQALEAEIATQISAAGIEGLNVEVRTDSQSGGMIVEVSDAFTDAGVNIGGADAAGIGVDTGTITANPPNAIAFNFGTARMEGKDHTLYGVAADNIFTAMNDLVRGLQANSAAGVAATIDDLERAHNRFLDARGQSGTRVRRLELASNRLGLENEQLGELSSEVMDTDLAEAAVDLARKEALFQAGINSTARILQISVLDFL